MVIFCFWVSELSEFSEFSESSENSILLVSAVRLKQKACAFGTSLSQMSCI